MRIEAWIGFTKTLKSRKEFDRWHKRIMQSDGIHIRINTTLDNK